MQTLEAVKNRGRLMELCCTVQAALRGQSKASSSQCFPLGYPDYWSKFRYNFIFYVDEMHLKGRNTEERRGGSRAHTVFLAHTNALPESRALKKSIVGVQSDC